MEQEGVIQFAADHEQRDLAPARYGALASALGAWRELFVQTGLLGTDPGRYGGLGFGNLSGRVTPPSLPMGRRRFLITGSQTGAHPSLRIEHYALVHSYSIRDNRVRSEGHTLPSSESMTHGAFYNLSPAIRFVFHVHAPTIWENARNLGLAVSDPSVSYGTPQMGSEVERLYRGTSLAQTRVMAMGGHTDGVIGFGRTAAEAGLVLMDVLARSYQKTS